MTEEQIKKEQDKLIEHLKNSYPNKDIDVTSLFVDARHLYGKDDYYLIRNVYGKIQEFVEFKNSFNGLLQILINTSDNVKVFAHLTDKGYEYIDKKEASTISKLALDVSFITLLVAFIPLVKPLLSFLFDLILKIMFPY